MKLSFDLALHTNAITDTTLQNNLLSLLAIMTLNTEQSPQRSRRDMKQQHLLSHSYESHKALHPQGTKSTHGTSPHRLAQRAGGRERGREGGRESLVRMVTSECKGSSVIASTLDYKALGEAPTTGTTIT